MSQLEIRNGNNTDMNYSNRFDFSGIQLSVNPVIAASKNKYQPPDFFVIP
jgi:hypothetical protein